jgi:hypothetical protein
MKRLQEIESRAAGALRQLGSGRMLWSALGILTALLLAYPMRLRLDPSVIWSTDVIPNLLLFGVLFYLWAAVLVLLVRLSIASDDVVARWQHLLLVLVSALVFRGSWLIHAPIQGQALFHVNDTKVWLEAGRLAFIHGVGYFDWPATSLVLITLAHVTGLGLFPGAAVVAVFIALTVGAMTYVLMTRMLPRRWFAALMSIFIIGGNLALTIYYQAGPMGIVFAVGAFVLLFRLLDVQRPADVVAFVLLTAAAVITHLHTSVNPLFFLGAIWIIDRVRSVPLPRPIPLLALFSFVAPAAWMIFWSRSGGLLWVGRGLDSFLRDPLDIWSRLTGALTIGKVNFGEAAPDWYSWTRIFWLVLLYVLGGIVWLWRMGRVRQLSRLEARIGSGLLGLGLLTLVSGLISPRGFGEILRTVTYVPFFSAPFLFFAIFRLPEYPRRLVLSIISVVFLILALPTFLADNRFVNTGSNHPIEFSVGEWLSSSFDRGATVKVFGGQPVLAPVNYYLPEAEYIGDRETESSGFSTESRWRNIADLVASFERASSGFGTTVFVQSLKMPIESRIAFGISLDDSHWGGLSQRLRDGHGLVYDNGPIQVFMGRSTEGKRQIP